MRNSLAQIFLIVNDETVGKHGEAHEPKLSRLWKSSWTLAPGILIKNPQQKAEGKIEGAFMCFLYSVKFSLYPHKLNREDSDNNGVYFFTKAD